MGKAGRKFDQDRRKFLHDSARTGSIAALVGLGLVSYARQANSIPATAIRPPGAVAEEDFTGACIRCGLCVRDCPYPTLSLATLDDDLPTGTPYFIARERPCEMCDDIPCVVACPTDALDPALTNIDDARMGLANVVDKESCIAFLGLRCEVCFNVCPVRGEAITLDQLHNQRSTKHAMFVPIVHSDACTGCGKCEAACILEAAAIKVLPNHLAQGKMQSHYRVGWREKADLGESLVTPDLEHQYNLPEGVEYEHGGRGLIEGEQGLPERKLFNANPLDTLNKKGAL